MSYRTIKEPEQIRSVSVSDVIAAVEALGPSKTGAIRPRVARGGGGSWSHSFGRRHRHFRGAAAKKSFARAATKR